MREWASISIRLAANLSLRAAACALAGYSGAGLAASSIEPVPIIHSPCKTKSYTFAHEVR